MQCQEENCKNLTSHDFSGKSLREKSLLIIDIKQEFVNKAVYSRKGWYYYSSLPTDRHLLGGENVAKVVDLEVYQIQK